MNPGGARLMIGFAGTRVSDALRRALHETEARGVILFARNIEDAAQCADLVAQIRALAPWPLVVAIDQEGGPVVRVRRGATVFPGNMALGSAGCAELALRQGQESGRQLAALGIDLNLAPVVDLQTNPANPGIGIRSLGADLERAEPLAAALVEGHLRAGVHSCLKHFPGKGAAAVDAHLELPVLEHTLEQFRRPHLEIFERLFARFPTTATMTTHMVVRGLDPDAPATLSAHVVRRLLRGSLRFGGAVLTDDLEMGAIVKNWGIAEAAVAAAAAGHDLILVCHEAERQREAAGALTAALRDGRLHGDEHSQSLARITSLCEGARARGPIDPASGDAVAVEIAERAVHLFGDSRRLLPLSAGVPTAVVAYRPTSVVGVEETAAGAFAPVLERVFADAGLAPVQVTALELTAAIDPAQLEAAGRCERVVFFGWEARGQAAVRQTLEALIARYRERLIVVHLRNPFDQALVPDDVTALTPFGYHTAQLRAVTGVLAGKLFARGGLPAPIRG
jgi:beta-N-acetylhexosaminidase